MSITTGYPFIYLENIFGALRLRADDIVAWAPWHGPTDPKIKCLIQLRGLAEEDGYYVYNDPDIVEKKMLEFYAAKGTSHADMGVASGSRSIVAQVIEVSHQVKIPESVDEAELMEKLGYAYLEQHAPHRLVKNNRNAEVLEKGWDHSDNGEFPMPCAHGSNDLLAEYGKLCVEAYNFEHWNDRRVVEDKNEWPKLGRLNELRRILDKRLS